VENDDKLIHSRYPYPINPQSCVNRNSSFLGFVSKHKASLQMLGNLVSERKKLQGMLIKTSILDLLSTDNYNKETALGLNWAYKYLRVRGRRRFVSVFWTITNYVSV